MLGRATGRAARPEKTDGSARSSWGLAPRKRRSHQGLRRCMYPRGRLPRRSRQMEHNQGCSPFYFSCQLSALLSPFSFLLSPFSFLLSPFSFLLSPCSLFLSPCSSSCERRSVFQQFCGKGQEKSTKTQESCWLAGCAPEAGSTHWKLASRSF